MPVISGAHDSFKDNGLLNGAPAASRCYASIIVVTVSISLERVAMSFISPILWPQIYADTHGSIKAEC